MIRWALALLLLSTSAVAQESVAAHMEGCLIWNAAGTVAVRNECSRPLTLMFMDFGDGQVVTADISAGGRFVTPSIWGQTGGFIFTACPIGYRPSVRFGLENREPISTSLYNCVGGRPNS